VRPLASGTAELAGRYEKWFSSPGVRLVPFDTAAARLYAVLRRDRSIKAPDAIQLACAGATGVNLFITNDLRLSRKIAPGVDFIVPLAQAFF
jgi:predicted nucleic acid-binding protein